MLTLPQRMRFYWRLDTKCLTLYKSDTSSHYHREIALAEMLAVDQMVTPELYPLTPPHVFEIVTSAMAYYVGVDMTGALASDLKPAQPVDCETVCVCVCVCEHYVVFGWRVCVWWFGGEKRGGWLWVLYLLSFYLLYLASML